MEKTLAREIYKKMEIDRIYTTSELFRLVEDSYYQIVPQKNWPSQSEGMPVNTMISNEMWKVVEAGYATTWKDTQTLANVRGLRYGSIPTSYTNYNFRYWKRIK